MNPWFNKFTPITAWGWVVYIFALAVLVWDYRIIHQTSQSTGDIIFTFFPHVAGMFLLVALIIKLKRVPDEQ